MVDGRMSRQKAKGTLLESKVVNYLRARLGDSEQTIHREVLHGTKDQGDITGLRIHGQPVVLECKNYSTYAGRLKEWMQEGRTEAGNADAPYWFVVFKQKGLGLNTLSSMDNQPCSPT
jgi:hypothetical protein